MLILDLKPDSPIIIGDNISIQFVKGSRSRCSIGINAPRDIEVNTEKNFKGKFGDKSPAPKRTKAAEIDAAWAKR